MKANVTAPDNPSPFNNALVAATSFHQVKLPNCDCKTKWGSAMGYAWEIADDGMVWKDGATSQGGCSGWVGMMLSPTDPELRLGVAILVNGYNKDAQTHTELVPDGYGRTILSQIYALITS